MYVLTAILLIALDLVLLLFFLPVFACSLLFWFEDSIQCFIWADFSYLFVYQLQIFGLQSFWSFDIRVSLSPIYIYIYIYICIYIYIYTYIYIYIYIYGRERDPYIKTSEWLQTKNLQLIHKQIRKISSNKTLNRVLKPEEERTSEDGKEKEQQNQIQSN